MEKGLLLHRAFSVFLFNSRNELLLQQRAEHKVTFPFVWTNTCCSHPLYTPEELDETNHIGVRRAAQRKLLNELGIKPESMPLDAFTPITRIHYKAPCGDKENKWGEHEVDYVLFAKLDVECEPNPEEVASIRYVSPEQLKSIVAEAETNLRASGGKEVSGRDGLMTLSPWFHLIVKHQLYDWWEALASGTLDSKVDMGSVRRLSFDAESSGR